MKKVSRVQEICTREQAAAVVETAVAHTKMPRGTEGRESTALLGATGMADAPKPPASARV